MPRMVLIAGFETFNADLYRKAVSIAQARCSELDIQTFSDRDITQNPEQVAHALDGAQVFLGSLLFDYDQVLWLKEQVAKIPIRLVFESALELMALTRLGRFTLAGSEGMPKPIRFVLDKFSQGREEDRIAGYLGLLNLGPKLLKYIPVQKVQDLRQWLMLYSYWNAGGPENVAALFWTLAQHYLGLSVGEIPGVFTTPDRGLVHPEAPEYFTTPRRYLQWYRHHNPLACSWPAVGILLYRKHVISGQPYIAQLIRHFEQRALLPIPIFINGVEGHQAVRDWLTTPFEQEQRQRGILKTSALSPEAAQVEAIVSTIGFPLVGGPAGSMEAGRQEEVARRILSTKNVPYIVSAPLLVQDIHSWTRRGIGGLQSVILYALPELDGAIDPVPLGGLVGERIYLVPERLERLTARLHAWIALRRTPCAQRRIAIVLYGFPPGFGAAGTAALLNVPQSLLRVLQALQQAGYTVGELPEDGEELIRRIKAADEDDTTPYRVHVYALERWLGYRQIRRILRQWGALTASPIKTRHEEFLLGGVQLGNIWLGVQPPLGLQGDPMRLMFERDLTPHPQYAGFYRWLEEGFQAHAVVHFGMHGTVEWLPGMPLGNTSYCWPDLLLGHLPNLYIYAANNPSESILAKRRGYGVLLSHNVPPYGRAGLYKELITVRDLICEYREDPVSHNALIEVIREQVARSGLERDCPQGEEPFDAYVIRLYGYLQEVENRLFSSGLHTLGQAPTEEQCIAYLSAYFGDRLPPQTIQAVAQGKPAPDHPCLAEALRLKSLLAQTTDELTNLLRGLNGEYIPPAPGGDLLRDGPGVLPTGRNIHALDPYRMPSAGALERGRAIARALLAQHIQQHGRYPETVAVMLWGLDVIKTRGESLGILLELVGAEPLKEGTGRIVRYALKPCTDLDHPRIDILGNLSGIFRDSFANILELLDDLFVRAAALEEPDEQNFIRKHARALVAQGVANPTARLFSNPPGDFGSLVNDRVIQASWESGNDLAQTWEGRNTFSYGRRDRGEARPEVLQALLSSTEHIIQEIDSVEYGITDIQEYYANTGALKRAAEQAQGQKVNASLVESFSPNPTPRPLEEILRLEYRSKLLNPRWAEAMANQGSGGAHEISQRMTALIGWAGTTDFQEGWVYEQASQTYALDPAMAQKLQQANPEAFRNILARMLEAHGRGYWQPDAATIEKLRALYDQSDEVLEGITSPP
ncbi:magnesium chelatase subunit H [Anthocerotibacter panamensis]|uniref:magnesium chelatase subunit H n=1 Tax=Anthocerotibacter panamensis TaxID=2857077 RepID=UPI001C40814E|nr:magnesium chelatase subunit H [Anthocerotibacter panamensis]